MNIDKRLKDKDLILKPKVEKRAKLHVISTFMS